MAARVLEKDKESTGKEDSDDFRKHVKSGDMSRIQSCLEGIVTLEEDDSTCGFGKHATTIRLGRSLWETPVLTEDDTRSIEGRDFVGRFTPI